ncbi:MAG: membrane protein insertase YidC, partial [Lautropia sp.]|nr:membrane protein insertase YidC [Lautropia sp.]
MMQTQRTILWVIFVMSLLFLWDSWQKHSGKPSLFGGSVPVAQKPGQGGPTDQLPQGSSAADASIPT